VPLLGRPCGRGLVGRVPHTCIYRWRPGPGFTSAEIPLPRVAGGPAVVALVTPAGLRWLVARGSVRWLSLAMGAIHLAQPHSAVFGGQMAEPAVWCYWPAMRPLSVESERAQWKGPEVRPGAVLVDGDSCWRTSTARYGSSGLHPAANRFRYLRSGWGLRVKVMSIHGSQLTPSSDRSQSAVIEFPSDATRRVDLTRAVEA
jgi:hypothetical protein